MAEDSTLDRTEVPRWTRALVVPGAAAAVVLILHLFRDAGATVEQRMLGALLGFASIGLLWRYWARRLFHRLPVPEIMVLQIYLYFGMPTITGALNYGPPVSHGAVTTALVACLLFVVCALLASKLGGWLGARARGGFGRLLPQSLPDGARVVTPVWVLAVGVANTGATHYLPTALHFPVLVATNASGLLVYLALRAPRKETPRNQRVAMTRRNLLLAAAFIGTMGLASGMLERVLQPFYIAALLLIVAYRYVPVRWLVIGAALFVLLNPFLLTLYLLDLIREL
ncbi:MAG: hypothetical protein JRI55_09725, partial [Deltaproteobacteria bacterium]|nr:hypothetical protein [Deltaproteobacteria bacterium]